MNSDSITPEILTDHFLTFLKQVGISPEEISLDSGLNSLVDFYKSKRYDWVEEGIDGDMLLFQYGSYDWGEGETFEINLTRQLMRQYDEEEEEEDDSNIFQLGITFYYDPKSFSGVEDFNHWSFNDPSVEQFHQFFKGTEGYKIALRSTPMSVKINATTV